MNQDTCTCTKHSVIDLKKDNPSIRKILQEKNMPNFGMFISKQIKSVY